MSSEVFPLDLPGLDLAIARRTLYATKILTTASGTELRATWWSEPRYIYTVNINFVRQFLFDPTLIADELDILQGFFDRHRGAFDDFLLDDPVDQVRRRVRFVDDALEFDRIADGVWEAKRFDLVSLKNT